MSFFGRPFGLVYGVVVVQAPSGHCLPVQPDLVVVEVRARSPGESQHGFGGQRAVVRREEIERVRYGCRHREREGAR